MWGEGLQPKLQVHDLIEAQEELKGMSVGGRELQLKLQVHNLKEVQLKLKVHDLKERSKNKKRWVLGATEIESA